MKKTVCDPGQLPGQICIDDFPEDGSTATLYWCDPEKNTECRKAFALATRAFFETGRDRQDPAFQQLLYKKDSRALNPGKPDAPIC